MMYSHQFLTASVQNDQETVKRSKNTVIEVLYHWSLSFLKYSLFMDMVKIHLYHSHQVCISDSHSSVHTAPVLYYFIFCDQHMEGFSQLINSKKWNNKQHI